MVCTGLEGLGLRFRGAMLRPVLGSVWALRVARSGFQAEKMLNTSVRRS